MAIEQIPPPSIWYAFKIRRSWRKTIQKTSYTFEGTVVGHEGDYKEGGTYTILEVQANDAAVYPASSWSSVASTLANDLNRARKTFPMPTHREGFAPSNVRAILGT